MKKVLWIRKLSCGHERPTNIAFSCRIYVKPKKSDGCYCRECCNNVDIISIRKADDKQVKFLQKFIGERLNEKS